MPGVHPLGKPVPATPAAPFWAGGGAPLVEFVVFEDMVLMSRIM